MYNNWVLCYLFVYIIENMNNLEMYLHTKEDPWKPPKKHEIPPPTNGEKWKVESLPDFVGKKIDTLWKLFRGAKKPWVEYIAPAYPTDTEKIKMIKNWTKYEIEESILDGGVEYTIKISSKEWKKYSIILGVDESGSSIGKPYFIAKNEFWNKLPEKDARNIVEKYISILK